MKIEIKNYKNIKDLELNIDDHKINYIFGISGSGKSSIGQAITKEVVEEDIMIGKEFKDVSILVDGKNTDTLNVNIFNENTMKNLILDESAGESIYRIMFSNGEKIFDLQDKFKELTKGLSEHLNALWAYVGKIDTLNKNFGGRVSKTGKLYATAKIEKYKKEFKKNEKYISKIRENGNRYLKWMTEGTKFERYTKSICPFCDEKLVQLKKEEIDEITEHVPDNFSVLYEDDSILEELKIPKPDYSTKDGIEIFEEEIVKKVNLKEEILHIIDLINAYQKIDQQFTVESIKTTDYFNKTFPKLKGPITEVNASIDELNKLSEQIKNTTNQTIHDNLEKLNGRLRKFGIPYEFKSDDVDMIDAKASYILYHVDDKSQKQRVNGLSFGEKNIVALLLFILSNHNKIVVIDDPASSFDDYRRHLIFEFLYETHCRETCLVLSHDPIFIKYASYSIKKMKKDFSQKTGKIFHFSNYESNVSLATIQWEDFKPIAIHIQNHLKYNPTMPYYQKIMNSRLLAELEKDRDDSYNLIYHYISEILHNGTDTIAQWLQNKNLTEQDILSEIKEKLKITLESAPSDLLEDFHLNNLTNFEKIVYFREKENISGDLIHELNDIVHLNTALAVLLNPYQFDYFSPHIYKEINRLSKEEVNVDELHTSSIE